MNNWFSKIIQKLSAFTKPIRDWSRSNPMLAVGVLALLLLATAAASISQLQSRGNSQALSEIRELPRTSLGEVVSVAKAGNLDRVITHQVKGGSWNQPKVEHYIEVVHGGQRHALYAPEAMVEQFADQVAAASAFSNVVFETGYVANEQGKVGQVLLVAFIVIMVVMVLLVSNILIGERLSGHSFKPHKLDRAVSLDSVIGYDHIKSEMREVIDQMVNAEKYARHSVRAPKGLLFTGDPGVGKTMMAKALANEMDAEFFYCTGADFVEMYVGVGAKRVRNLFRKARECRRAFIFIDEIDALGSRNSMGNDSERLATLNQMLSELDGINANGQLLVMGATNYPDRLDPAMVRAGRFDRTIHIPMPDLTTRRELLRHKLKGLGSSANLDFDALAQRTIGYSGAQLCLLADEAMNLAVRHAGGPLVDNPVITQELMERAQENAIMGSGENVLTPEQARRSAVHELGHALVGFLRCKDSFTEKASIEGRGGALGFTINRPNDDRRLRTQEDLTGEIMMLLAGRAAEQEILGSISTGARDDLSKANDIAQQMVCLYGMGKNTGLMMLPASQDGRPSMSENMQKDIKALLDELYDSARALVLANRSWIEDRASLLLQRGTLDHATMFLEVRPVDVAVH